MLSSPTTPNNTNFFALALVKALVISGVCILAGALLHSVVTLPTGQTIGAGLLIGGIYFLRDFTHTATWLEHVWREEQSLTAARLRFEARTYTGDWPQPEQGAAEAAEQQPLTDRLFHHNGLHGSYFTRDLTPAEVAEATEIGECLRFLAVAKKAGGYSVRVMAAHAPPGYSYAQFEKWWTARTNQLAAWGLFEKGERTPTRPVGNRAIPDIRTALLRREFRRTLPPPPAADRQTDSKTAEIGEWGRGLAVAGALAEAAGA
jgi:hypothetical protein